MNNIIKQYFDKSALLATKNKVYAETCLQLFDFQIKNDLVENDITSKIISGQYKDTKVFVISKQAGVVAGIEEVVFLIEKRTDLKVKIFVKNGTVIKNKDKIIIKPIAINFIPPPKI